MMFQRPEYPVLASGLKMTSTHIVIIVSCFSTAVNFNRNGFQSCLNKKRFREGGKKRVPNSSYSSYFFFTVPT